MSEKQVETDATLKELPKKLRHENALARQLRALYRSMREYQMIQIQLTGNISSLSVFEARLNEILNDSYLKTSKTFKNEIRKKLELGRILNEEIDAAIAKYTASHNPGQATIILKNATRDFEKIRDKVLAQQEGAFITNNDLSRSVDAEFGKRSFGRIQRIAATEIQNISEQSKLIEAENLVQNNIIKVMRRWDAVLDRRTRPFHAAADGQRREINEPFTVNGEQLMRPGDTSLGASLSNVINCRCSIQFINLRVV